MTVTVIVPTRNRPALLRQTLQAILSQTAEIEVMVVDDASDQPLGPLVPELRHPAVRVLRQPVQIGVANARNLGIAESTAPYVAFCDDDDLWAPTKIQRQLDAMERTATPWAITGSVNFHGEGVVERLVSPLPAEVTLQRLPHINTVPGGCSNVVVRRELLDEVGGFDPTLRIMADWDLWVRLARRSAPAVVHEHLVGRRLHDSNMSRDDAAILSEIRHLEDRTRDLRGGAGFSPRWVHLKLGNAAVNSGDRRRAVHHHLAAVVRGDRTAARKLLATIVLGTGPRRFAITAKRDQRQQDVDVPWLSALFADAPDEPSPDRLGHGDG